MLTVRCTRKLLKYLHAQGPAEGIHPTTGLGDWYANLLFTKRLRLVICVGERSLLPVFVEAKDRSSFAIRFQEQVRSVLECVGVPSYAVERERHEMTQVEVSDSHAPHRKRWGCLRTLVKVLDQPVSHHRRAATADQIASTIPNGQAP